VHWSAWVLLAWLAGAAALLLPLLAGTIIVWRQARRAERINSGSWVHLLDELRPQLGVRGRVVLLRSNWPNIPLTCGIFRPAIILPAEADDWPADRRRVVLLHELAHIRRRDCLTQLLARLARVIYWFNPLVWLAGRMLRIEREQACDDLVLASGHKASDYAGHLLEIVRSLHSVRCPSLAAVAMARKSQFEGRLLAILDPRRNRRSLTRLGILIAAVLVAAVAVPLAVLKATGPEKPVAAKADEPARKFPALVVFVNNCRYGPTNGGSSIPPEGGVMQETGKSTNGHPGAVSEVEWKYLRTTDAGDEYEVTRRFPIDTPTPSTEKKTVTYSGKPLTVFEDDVQRVLFLSREDFKSLQEGKAIGPTTHGAEPATQPAAKIGVAELEKRRIEGKVVDADGKPVADAEVLILKLGPHYMGLDYPFEQEIVARTRSDADGRFLVVVTGIPEEVYLEAIARKPGAGFGYNQCIGLPAWDGRMREVRLHKTGLLEGLVVDESGQPVADAQVRADVFGDEDSGEPDVLGCPNLDWFVTRTGKDGRFVLSGVPADMRAEFIVRAAGHGTVATQVPHQAPRFRTDQKDIRRFRTGQKDIRIVLPPQCRIEGVVIDKSTGKPVADVQLIAFGGHVPDNSTGMPPSRIGSFITPPGLAKADKDGRFVMEALEPGRWTVALAQQRMIECTEPAQWVAQPLVVDLAAGKSQSIRVELSRGETVDVALVDAATGAPVRGRLSTFAQKEAMEAWSAQVSDDKGIVRLRLLPGRYTLFASDYPNHVVIPGQEAPRPFHARMDLTVEPGKSQHVQVQLSQEPTTQPADAAAAELERLWGELASKNQGQVEKAALTMAALGDKAVGFLRSQLLPDAKMAERIRLLIADMDSDQYAVRAKASKALADIGRRAVPLLTDALDDKDLSAEKHTRLTQLVSTLAVYQREIAEMRRLGRAVWILGKIKTESARDVLLPLTTGPKDDAISQAARQAVAPWGSAEFDAASAFLCDQAGSRELAAKRFAAMADRNPGHGSAPVARELAGLLGQMVNEDARYQEPKDPNALSASQRMDDLIHKLRDVHERAVFVPGKVRAVGSFGSSNENAAMALRKLGKPVMPVLFELLADRRPTRSRSEGPNGNHILRYCDVALEIIEAMSARQFDKPRGRGTYLANADEATREVIVDRVKQWWQHNKHKTEAEWLRESLGETGVGSYVGYLDSAERLIELEGAKSVDFFRQRLEAEPANGHIIGLLWKAGGDAVLEDIQAQASGKDPAMRISAYRVLLRAGVPGTLDKVRKELAAMFAPSQREYLASILAALAYSGRKDAVLVAARLIEHEDPKVGYEAFRTVMHANRVQKGLAPTMVKMLMPYAASALHNEEFSTDARYWAACWMVQVAKLSIPVPENPTAATRQAFVVAVSGWWAQHKDEYPKATEPALGVSAPAQSAPATPPTTQPAGSKLEFRIAPKPSTLSETVREWYLKLLREGQVGFWWRQPPGVPYEGPVIEYIWLPISGELTNGPQLVTGEYNGQKYVLVSDKPGQTMVPGSTASGSPPSGEGNDAWGLAKVYATTDAMNLPAVGFEMDDRGAELFSAFTKANIGNVLAIVVDGKVISAPRLMAALGKHGMITGRFSEQEVKDLVQALKAGMVPARPLSATARSSLPASAPIDPAAVWEAKVGQTITVQGHAVRDLLGVRYLRLADDTYPYSIELEHVLPDLRGGQLLPVRVTGTLRLRKHTVSKEEVEQYKRNLAENKVQMQFWDPQVGQIIRHYYIPDADVTVLPVATEPASQPAKASPLAGLKIRLVLADKRKEYRIGETVKFNVLAENTGKQAVEFSLDRYPPTSYSNMTEGGLIRLRGGFSFYRGGEIPEENFVIRPGRSTLLDTEEYLLMPPDWRGNTAGRPGVIGVKPQKYSVSYRLNPNYAGQVRREVLDSEPLVAIDVLPGDPERIRQLTAKYPSGREVAEKFALEFLAAVRKGDAETMNRMIQIHTNFGPKNPSSCVSSAAEYTERMKQSQQWWQELARQIRAKYAGHEDLLSRLSETYCMPEDSPRPGAVCVRIAGPANPRDGSLWLQLSCWSDGWRVTNGGFGDPKTSLKQLLIGLMAEGAKPAAGGPATQPATASAPAEIDVLATRLTGKISMKELPLEDALKAIQRLSGFPIFTKWGALKEISVSQKTPVRVELSNPTLAEALQAVLESAAGPDMLSFSYSISDRLIYVTSVKDSTTAVVVRRAYGVQDLLTPAGGHTQESLTKLLEENVKPGSWGPSWPKVGTIIFSQGNLIVSQTPEAHQAILRLIANLRTL
jgi:beta-lactamase regulating signal transducer with metallopeptidase domain